MSRSLLALTPGHRESTESWSEVLRDLRDRGLDAPRLLVGDGALGIWAALGNVWPGAPVRDVGTITPTSG